MTPPPAEKVAEPFTEDKAWIPDAAGPFIGPFRKANNLSGFGPNVVLDSAGRFYIGCIDEHNCDELVDRLNAAAPAPSVAQSEREASGVCAEIIAIMEEYDRQEASAHGVDTPGGLEHMGDVWCLLDSWRDQIVAARASAGSATVDADTIAKQIVDEWAGLYCDDGSRLDPKWQEIAAIITAHTHSAPPALTEEERKVVEKAWGLVSISPTGVALQECLNIIDRRLTS